MISLKVPGLLCIGQLGEQVSFGITLLWYVVHFEKFEIVN